MSLIKLTDDCGHDDFILERRFDDGFYDSVYKLCKNCTELSAFNKFVISQKEIIN